MSRFLRYIVAICAMCCFSQALSAQFNDYVLDINDFSELKVVNDINVEYIASNDTVGKAYFSCDQSLCSRLIFSPKGKKLKIEVDMMGIPADTPLPVLKLYSTCLEKVENTADSTITIRNIGKVEHFKAKVVGNGLIKVEELNCLKADFTINTGKGDIVVGSGEVQSVSFKNVGKGLIDAEDLNVQMAKVILLGTGNIECTIHQSLSIYGTGSGTIYYHGNPERITNRSIGVKNKKL